MRLNVSSRSAGFTSVKRLSHEARFCMHVQRSIRIIPALSLEPAGRPTSEIHVVFFSFSFYNGSPRIYVDSGGRVRVRGLANHCADGWMSEENGPSRAVDRGSAEYWSKPSKSRARLVTPVMCISTEFISPHHVAILGCALTPPLLPLPSLLQPNPPSPPATPDSQNILTPPLLQRNPPLPSPPHPAGPPRRTRRPPHPPRIDRTIPPPQAQHPRRLSPPSHGKIDPILHHRLSSPPSPSLGGNLSDDDTIPYRPHSPAFHPEKTSTRTKGSRRSLTLAGGIVRTECFRMEGWMDGSCDVI